MAITKRLGAVIASGLVLVVAAAVAGAWLLPGSGSWPVLDKLKASLKASITASRPAALASGQVAPCPLQAAAAVAGEKDGKFPLHADLSGWIAADIASFMALGKETAAAGRPRDAEVAFLMSCRVADKFMGANSVDSADARVQLGGHYAKLAREADPAAGADRAELLRRAELLYSNSSQIYLAKYGQAHEKSRLAAQGLAAVRQTLAQTVQPVTVPVPVSTLATATDELESPPKLAQATAGAVPIVSPLPATAAKVKTRQDPPVFKECPQAVATLGLCDRDK